MSDKFGQIEGLSLKKYRLLKVLILTENFQIETKTCNGCDFSREILYSAYYETKNEVFDICELCGKELIEDNRRILQELKSK
jgi:hypothetical protein